MGYLHDAKLDGSYETSFERPPEERARTKAAADERHKGQKWIAEGGESQRIYVRSLDFPHSLIFARGTVQVAPVQEEEV